MKQLLEQTTDTHNNTTDNNTTKTTNQLEWVVLGVVFFADCYLQFCINELVHDVSEDVLCLVG